MAARTRLDQFLVQNGISQSREKGRNEIIAGWVKVNGETVRTPSRIVFETDKVVVERPGGLFVSRGGEKLKRAIESFGIDLKGTTAVDLGASTGGFTHCMLVYGAKKVYAIDVGYGQLDYSIRSDERVVVMERTNARDLDRSMFAEKIDFVTADLSFISIIKIFPKIIEVFSPVKGVVLIKPQFEAGQSEHKKGVVRKIETHVNILSRTLNAVSDLGISIKGVDYSPIKGPKGNIEFLLYYSEGFADDKILSSAEIDSIAEKISADAHKNLD